MVVLLTKSNMLSPLEIDDISITELRARYEAMNYGLERLNMDIDKNKNE